jgi:DNA repair exonuclease SbcCD ATPase subunit
VSGDCKVSGFDVRSDLWWEASTNVGVESMSLKLDELRKRLLQQQAGNDVGVPETPPAMSGGRILGVATQKTPEVAAAPKTSEPPTRAKTPETAKTPEVLIYAKAKPVEATAEAAPAAPQQAGQADEASESLNVSSPKPQMEPDALNARPSVPPPLPSGPVGQNELAEAVGKVFEQTKALQTRLEDLNRIFDPIDRVGDSAARAFGPLRGFQKQMALLAKSFGPMRAFQAQLSQIAQTFEPMKALEDQLSQLADSFRSHIADLIKALEPAKQLRERIQHLSAAFEEANELQEQFGELYEAFQLSPASNGTHANGFDAQSSVGR